MKITKTQLRQIIKEEVSKVLNETNLIKEDMGISQDYAHMFDVSRSEGGFTTLWGSPNDGFSHTPTGEYDGLLAMRKKAEAEGNKKDFEYYTSKLKELLDTQKNPDNIYQGDGRQPFPPQYK